MPEEPKSIELLPLVSDVVAAHLSNNTVRSSEVAPLIRTVYQALAELASTEHSTVRPESAVPIEKSVTPDYIICLEDGRQLRMLKRHLRTAHGMSPVSTALECASELSDGGAELCQEAQQACEGYWTWYRATSEARKGVAQL